LAAVAQNGRALEFADETFTDDRDVVLTAVAQNGLALEFADELLQGDRDVDLAAATLQDNYAFVYVDEGRKSDPAFRVR